MVRVSHHFGLTGPLPFLNVHVDSDNKLFLDPSAIRAGRSTRSRRAHQLLVEFFTEILRCAGSRTAADHAKGLRLLQSLHEPNETRLGMSRHGARGHGFADEMGQRLWEEIRSNRTLQSKVLSRLEEVPFFIRRVDKDMISDLATRIVFKVLADFTHKQMKTYPALAVGATTVEHPIWSSGVHDLRPKHIQLPHADGKQLLLIPKKWVYWRLVMDPEAFYNRYSTQTIQDEQTTYASNGRRNAPTKKSIRNNHRDHKFLNTMQAVKYMDQHDRNLVVEYREAVDAEFVPMSDDEIEGRLD